MTFPFPIVAPSALDLSLNGIITSVALTSGLKLALDAGASDSYSGSGSTWFDQTTNDSDWSFGASSAAPTFNGSAGALTSSEYMSFDGGDYFQIASQPSWLNDLHKDNAKGTLLMALNLPAPPGAGQAMWSGVDASGGNGTGIAYWCDSSGGQNLPKFFVRSGGGNVLTKTAGGTMTASAWHIIAVSWDEAAGASGGFFYKDGALDGSASDFAYSGPGAGDNTVADKIGDGTSLSSKLQSGSKIACVAAWSGVALTSGQLDSIYAKLKTRFGLS